MKSFQHKKDHPGVLFYRYNYCDEYKAIRISGRCRYSSPAVVQQAYDYRIPSSQAKYHNDRKLCNQMVIPVQVHEWYNTLPTSARVVDKLPAPSIDDSGDDDDDALIKIASVIV